MKYPLNPYGNLMTQPVALAGGLNDSQAIPDPTTMQVLSNWVVFRGRFAVRAPVTVTVQLLDDAGSPAPVTSVLAGRFHKNKFYVIAFSSNTNKTYLYRLNPDGTSEGTPNGTQSTFVAVLWTGATLSAPMMVSFDGGIAGTPVSRLYIADNNNQYDTLFWNSDANTINNLQNDFADSGALHNTRYTYIWKYQYSMWGSGFYQFGAATRPEMMRFSQPGLIPSIEPDMAGAVGITAQEWWNVDHREAGDRGDPITTVAYAGGAAIIFKRRQAYALFGYDADTWSLRPISDKVGAIGPYAACSTEDGFCYFWSDRGPHMTDGQTVVDIGGNIRKFVQAVGFNPTISAEYSVDDSMVYFAVPQTGSGTPNSYLGYQRQQAAGPAQGLFSSGQWLNSGGTALLVTSMAAIPNQTLPPPQAAPSALVLTPVSGTEVDLTWVNGDTSLDTTTEIWRGPTSGTETLLTTVASGVAFYADTGLTPTTNYFYKIRHVRNAQNSAYSTEQSTRTFCATPTLVAANSIATGVRISYTNNQAGADIVIERGVNGTTFSAITTVSNPGTGAFTFDDTSGTVGITYYYRVKAKKTAEADSAYSSPVVNAVFGFPPPAMSSANLTITQFGTCLFHGNITWSGTFFTANDTAKIYQSFGGGGFFLIATVSLQSGAYTDTLDNPPTNTTVQYRVDAYDEGTTLSSTATTPSRSLNHIAGCPA